MKLTKNKIISFLAIAMMVIAFQNNFASAQEPWSKTQLLAPAELNKIINNPKAPKTYIYSIGYQAVIKNSIDIGAGGNKNNQNKLKQQVSKLPKDANIVIYCGCCPFATCPNVRPVFQMLTDMGFKNHKLLDLKQNIKVDWIDKGFAVKK
jgi:hypothetical protein